MEGLTPAMESPRILKEMHDFSVNSGDEEKELQIGQEPVATFSDWHQDKIVSPV